MLKRIYKRVLSEKNRILIRMQISKLVHPYYLGNCYSCNCCNKSFRKFLPKGQEKRENAQCPYCGSLERTRILLFYLKNETDILYGTDRSILHFAPERPLYALLKRLNHEYIDGDINPACARHLIDITSIQYPGDYFDLVICSHVLGHVHDEERAIREIRRVMRKDGSALIMTLLKPDSALTIEDPGVVTEAERLIRYGEPDLCRLHGLDFEERLKREGLSVERIDYREKLPEEVVEKYRLGDGRREIIFKCTK